MVNIAHAKMKHAGAKFEIEAADGFTAVDIATMNLKLPELAMLFVAEKLRREKSSPVAASEPAEVESMVPKFR